jgi:hypothetical protein
VKRRLLLAALVLAAGLRTPLPGVETEFRSQLSGWLSLNDGSPSTPRFGLRWQPAVSLAQDIGSGWKLDGEFSFAAAASGSAPAWSHPALDGEFQPYRLWLRLSAQRFEARLGLQKLNFGSATVFRPLMWFDRVDPRDPLQLTDGTWGLLLRYYFRNNANAWLWGLYGNSDPKGWETLPTARRTPEFGGRLQVPLFSGEAAASVHYRRSAITGDPAGPAAGESRFALDGKWDIGVGFWVEGAFTHQDGTALMVPVGSASPLPWQRSLAAGVDTTFALGNGLYLLAEQFFSQAAATPLGAAGGGLSFSALLARYPLGLLDSLGAIVYFDWRSRKMYNFVSWQRTTDRWQFHVMAFWNPGQAAGPQGLSGAGMFAGRGMQLLAVWNI